MKTIPTLPSTLFDRRARANDDRHRPSDEGDFRLDVLGRHRLRHLVFLGLNVWKSRWKSDRDEYRRLELQLHKPKDRPDWFWPIYTVAWGLLILAIFAVWIATVIW